MLTENCRILLLGGGYTLTRVASLLAPHSFVITTTNPSKLEDFKAKGWNAALVDSGNASTLDDIVRKYPAIEVLVDSIPTRRSVREEQSVFTGAENICGLSSRFSLSRYIYLSTTGVYGVSDGSWVDERSKCQPGGASATARLKIEEILQSSFSGFTALRLPAIYGPGRGIGTALKLGRYRLIKDHDRWSNRIHVNDLARIIFTAIGLQSLAKIICISDGTPALQSEVVDFYCKTFSLPAPLTISRQEAEANEMHSLLSNQRVSNTLMRELFNFKLFFPSYRQGAETEFEVNNKLGSN